MALKIQEALSSRTNLAGIAQLEEKKSSEISESNFQGQLNKAEYRIYKGKLEELVQQIFDQGKKLEKRLDIKELMVYKRLVSEFLNEYLNNSYKFMKQNVLDRRGRYRVYSTIKKINDELDNLVADVLSNQKDNLKILQRLDDIRGLILDLLM